MLVEKERSRAEGYDDARERFMAREPRPLGAEERELCQDLPSRAELHERSSVNRAGEEPGVGER